MAKKKKTAKSNRRKMKPNPTWADKPARDDADATMHQMPVKLASISDGKNKVSIGMSCDVADIDETMARKLLVGGNMQFDLSDPREVQGQELLPGAGGEKKEISLSGDVGSVTMALDHFSWSLKVAGDQVDLNKLRKFKFKVSRADIKRVGDNNGAADDEGAEAETAELAMSGDMPE